MAGSRLSCEGQGLAGRQYFCMEHLQGTCGVCGLRLLADSLGFVGVAVGSCPELGPGPPAGSGEPVLKVLAHPRRRFY